MLLHVMPVSCDGFAESSALILRIGRLAGVVGRGVCVCFLLSVKEVVQEATGAALADPVVWFVDCRWVSTMLLPSLSQTALLHIGRRSVLAQC